MSNHCTLKEIKSTGRGYLYYPIYDSQDRGAAICPSLQKRIQIKNDEKALVWRVSWGELLCLWRWKYKIYPQGGEVQATQWHNHMEDTSISFHNNRLIPLQNPESLPEVVALVPCYTGLRAYPTSLFSSLRQQVHLWRMFGIMRFSWATRVWNNEGSPARCVDTMATAAVAGETCKKKKKNLCAQLPRAWCVLHHHIPIKRGESSLKIKSVDHQTQEAISPFFFFL